MIRNSTLIAISAILIGLGGPAIAIYYGVYYGFSHVIAGIIAVTALTIAGSLLFFGIVSGPLGREVNMMMTSERRKLNMMRTHLRATLEELDEIIGVLKEIRDLLKGLEE